MKTVYHCAQSAAVKNAAPRPRFGAALLMTGVTCTPQPLRVANGRYTCIDVPSLNSVSNGASECACQPTVNSQEREGVSAFLHL
jgi:hypothetical protein